MKNPFESEKKEERESKTNLYLKKTKKYCKFISVLHSLLLLLFRFINSMYIYIYTINHLLN